MASPRTASVRSSEHPDSLGPQAGASIGPTFAAVGMAATRDPTMLTETGPRQPRRAGPFKLWVTKR